MQARVRLATSRLQLHFSPALYFRLMSVVSTATSAPPDAAGAHAAGACASTWIDWFVRCSVCWFWAHMLQVLARPRGSIDLLGLRFVLGARAAGACASMWLVWFVRFGRSRCRCSSIRVGLFGVFCVRFVGVWVHTLQVHAHPCDLFI